MNNSKKTVLVTLLVLLLTLLLPTASFADAGGSGATLSPDTPVGGTSVSYTTLDSPIAATNVPQFINAIISKILSIVGAVALLMFVYGGVLWMTSAGNTERVTKGKETLTWATIGLIVIFASYAILTLVFNALT